MLRTSWEFAFCLLICHPVIPLTAHRRVFNFCVKNTSCKKHILVSPWSRSGVIQSACCVCGGYINNPCTSSLWKFSKFQCLWKKKRKKKHTNNDIPPPSVSKREMHWKVKTLQSLPLFLSHNRSRKWVSFPPFICVAFPGETVATPPYLCYCRVLQWIMKWIMQMSHNIFILTKVEVHVPVPGIYEYTHILKMAGMCYNLMEMNSNDCYNYCNVLCLVFNLWN